MTDATQLELWTIGYEGCVQHQVIGALVEAGIEQLVDVRIRAQSRKPGFSKTTLGTALQGAGIDYVHWRELGTPLDIKGLFRAKHALAEARAAYLEHLVHDTGDALERLAAVAAERRTAILCFEHDPVGCHRRVVAEELQRRTPGGVAVHDLDPWKVD